MGMQIKDISDKAFSAYGKVITGLDVTGILKEMEHTPLPDEVISVSYTHLTLPTILLV